MTIPELFADFTPTPAAYLKAARALDAVADLRRLRVAVLASFTAEFLAPYLRVEGARRGFAITPWFAPWGQLEEQALDAASALFAEKPGVIVIFAPEVDDTRLAALLAGLRMHAACPIFVANTVPAHGGLVSPLDERNAALATVCRGQPDVF